MTHENGTDSYECYILGMFPLVNMNKYQIEFLLYCNHEKFFVRDTENRMLNDVHGYKNKLLVLSCKDYWLNFLTVFFSWWLSSFLQRTFSWILNSIVSRDTECTKFLDMILLFIHRRHCLFLPALYILFKITLFLLLNTIKTYFIFSKIIPNAYLNKHWNVKIWFLKLFLKTLLTKLSLKKNRATTPPGKTN